jgi:PP-loop superfamily ATP-utilizing enzyme
VSADERVARARQLLEEAGIPGAEIEVEGHEREMAAIRVPPAHWERVAGDEGARLAAAVKSAGFRYVALDLRPADAPTSA